MDLVWLIPVIALHASELVRYLLPLILLVWVWKNGVKDVNTHRMGALGDDLVNGCFMKGVWALRKCVSLCLPDRDVYIPALASHPIGVEKHFKKAEGIAENVSSGNLDSILTCLEEISKGT